MLTIKKLEEAINQCVRSEQSVDRLLTPDATLLAEIYGLMIFQKVDEIDIAHLIEIGVFDKRHSAAIEKFGNSENE